jgi:GTPase SAR1 family protein
MLVLVPRRCALIIFLLLRPGQEEYENIRVMSYERADAFVLSYSVMDPPSFHSIRDVWWPEVPVPHELQA